MSTKTTTKKAAASEPLRGIKLLRTAVNQILNHPETWRQTSTHCGSCHCIGGWIQILGGYKEDSDNIPRDIMDGLGVSSNEAFWLFSGGRTLGEIYNYAKNFDRDGFDRAGFDRDGFDRAGFDRAGFDRAGFDRAGFDRAGFDRDGFDRAGFDRAGRDRAGNSLEPFVL